MSGKRVFYLAVDCNNIDELKDSVNLVVDRAIDAFKFFGNRANEIGTNYKVPFSVDYDFQFGLIESDRVVALANLVD
jgi:hypothetical protein